MVVLFQGTHNDNHYAATVLASCAVLAAKKNRKTLAIQLTSAGQTEIEDLLVGKKKAESRIADESMGNSGAFRISDRGIDALQRRSESQKLVKEHFNSSCEVLLEDNLLDIATITEKEDFIETLTVSGIENIIQHAKKVYDCIFILLEGTNKDIMKEMLVLADTVVTCISQNGVRENYNQNNDVKNILVLTDYENTSIYNAGYVKNMYGVKKIYKVSHNISFKDAYTTGVLKDFIMENADSSTKDELYDLFKELNVIVEALFGKIDFEDAKKDLNRLETEETKEETQLKTFENVSVEEKEEKKGFFGRSKKTKRVLVKQEADVPEIEYENTFLETDSNTERTVIQEVSNEDAKESLIVDEIVDEMEDEDVPVVPVDKDKASTIRPLIEPKTKPKKGPEKEKPEPKKIFGKKEKAEKAKPVKGSEAELVDWICEDCGAENNGGKFCMECGSTRPKPKKDNWKCKCGAENEGGKFCMECGKGRIAKWFCPECGAENKGGKFCMECGYEK